jgi:chitodextrinase
MYLAGANATPVYNLLGVDGLVVPEGTEFTSGPCESIGGTPPFDVAFIDGYIGFRRQNAGHIDSPGWPSFVQMSKKVLDLAPFATVTGVEAGTLVESNTWTVEGLAGPTTVRVVSGEYRTDGGWTSDPGIIDNGARIQVRHVSACASAAPTTTTLAIGESVYMFTSITAHGSACPDLPPAWDPNTVYTAGDQVSYDGAVYLATWWTRNEVPGASPYGAWQEIVTDADGTAIWTPSRIFTSGDVVVHEGRRYTAKWWTRNQVPGDPWGPWEPLS